MSHNTSNHALPVLDLKNVPYHCRLAGRQMLILLLMYELSRLVFYLFNHVYYSHLSFTRLAYYFVAGSRFDVCAILFTNLPFIVLSIIPAGSEKSIYRRFFLPILFLLVNALALFMQFGDTVFFQYTYKRSTADIFKFLELGSDTADVLPSLLRSYWYMFFLWGLFVVITGSLYRRSIRKSYDTKPDGHHYIAAAVSSYILTAAVVVIGFRGGWQLKPISILDAAGYGPSRDFPLIINTPFSLGKTLGVPPLRDYHFFSTAHARSIYPTLHQPTEGIFRRLNVVTIILESFSKEYVGALNNRHRTNTPFLDSLIGQSLVCDNAFSDGRKSIEGIPAVVAGLPSWMEEPYITSNYNSDNFQSLASLLTKENYTTAFFHGGTNGTMGFSSFCRGAGFRYYYGRSEFNNDKCYDGHWGIWDHIFLQYFARNLDTMREPFYAALFTLSSHEPFSIPDSLKTTYTQQGDEMPILKCVRYSDMALHRFFQTASKMPWFDSTLFVITADHAGPSHDPYYSNRVGMYEIPIIFYMHNSALKGRIHKAVEQIDIMPSVLDYLHYPYTYFAFGRSIFDSTGSHIAVNYLNNCYELINSPYCLQFEGQRCTALYNCSNDSLLGNNLLAKQPAVKDSMAKILKSVLQQYSNDLIHNNLHTN